MAAQLDLVWPIGRGGLSRPRWAAYAHFDEARLAAPFRTDPAGDGLPVLQAIRKASRRLTD